MARKNLFNFRYMSKLFSVLNDKPLSAHHVRKFSSFRSSQTFSDPRVNSVKWYSDTKVPWVDSELKNSFQQDPKPQVTEQSTFDDEDEKKRRDDAWKKMKYSLLALGSLLGACGGTVVYTLGKPQMDENGNIIRDEFSSSPVFIQYIKRMLKELEFYSKMIKEPSREKLLPDPLKYPYMQPPYTLVLELKDLLVHPEWTYQTGWRFKKRPGVDKFLEQCGPPNFEIVVFTAEQGMTAFPILDSLDPNGYIMYRLVRDATDFIEGHHVKNLDCLNRDLSKVIVIDWDNNSVKLHGNNAFLIPRWNGNDDDTTLVDLAAFLKTIASSNVDDVRDVLTYYRSFDNPIEAFRDNQKKLLEQLEEQERQTTEKRKNQPLTSRWSNTLLNRK